MATCERYFSELALIHTALRNTVEAENQAPDTIKRSRKGNRVWHTRAAQLKLVHYFAAGSSCYANIQYDPSSNTIDADGVTGDEDLFEVEDIVSFREEVLAATEDSNDRKLQELLA
ncbi:hypothetical protein F441_12551 [Phytophthora nicotianae CJ01A1]|uniref:HAT C-terminal dimerisation domain-containing protein n=1 Tax=Phytophthora nicotianae CJ01A1 TaxID=1317063 RepID=W2WNS9_PHYNI|nr:hypothetical protein F441_12551 [Phytophthora nicotianae CJ01A1]